MTKARIPIQLNGPTSHSVFSQTNYWSMDMKRFKVLVIANPRKGWPDRRRPNPKHYQRFDRLTNKCRNEMMWRWLTGKLSSVSATNQTVCLQREERVEAGKIELESCVHKSAPVVSIDSRCCRWPRACAKSTLTNRLQSGVRHFVHSTIACHY